jgi:hypothetical protein
MTEAEPASRMLCVFKLIDEEKCPFCGIVHKIYKRKQLFA